MSGLARPSTAAQGGGGAWPAGKEAAGTAKRCLAGGCASRPPGERGGTARALRAAPPEALARAEVTHAPDTATGPVARPSRAHTREEGGAVCAPGAIAGDTTPAPRHRRRVHTQRAQHRRPSRSTARLCCSRQALRRSAAMLITNRTAAPCLTRVRLRADPATQVNVRIMGIDAERQRVSLSMLPYSEGEESGASSAASSAEPGMPAPRRDPAARNGAQQRASSPSSDATSRRPRRERDDMGPAFPSTGSFEVRRVPVRRASATPVARQAWRLGQRTSPPRARPSRAAAACRAPPPRRAGRPRGDGRGRGCADALPARVDLGAACGCCKGHHAAGWHVRLSGNAAARSANERARARWRGEQAVARPRGALRAALCRNGPARRIGSAQMSTIGGDQSTPAEPSRRRRAQPGASQQF